MKHCVRTLLLILFVSNIATAQNPVYKNEAGRFKINFPKTPEATVRDQETEIGTLKMHLFVNDMSKYKNENNAYLLTYIDYPDSLISSDFKDEIVDDFLNNSMQGAIKSSDGKMEKTSSIPFNKYPSRYAAATVKDGAAIMHIKVILVKSRMYIFEVIAETQTFNLSKCNDFINSFGLLPAAKK